MNERQAMEMGLTFTGATAGQYEWNKPEREKLKAEAKHIRKLGFQAEVVKSLKSEWGGGSYLLYVEPAYMDYKQAISDKIFVDNKDLYIQKIREDMEAKIKFIEDTAQAKITFIKEVESKTGIKIL